VRTPYSISFTRAAQKSLRAIDVVSQRRIAAAVELLTMHPLPPKAVALKGRDGYRIRVGDYRVLYQVRREEILIVVIDVGHRRDVYR
jgi:mRNA interferase RelE/StbE